MEILHHKHDIWGREVLLGISWDLLWLILVAAFLFIVLHGLFMAMRKNVSKPSNSGARLERHALVDRWFHWLMALSVLVLIATGVIPILGLKFSWLTLHWVTGLLLTAVIAWHIIRSLFFKNPNLMLPTANDLMDPLQTQHKPGKYSLAQKSLHAAMAVLVLGVIVTGLYLMSNMQTPWWPRSNWLSEAALGWMFVLHGFSTLGLVGLICLHIYFGLRPDKRFYTRAMIKGWISTDEYSSEHDPAAWQPQSPHE